MGYLFLLAKLNGQTSAGPNARQCHGECDIGNGQVIPDPAAEAVETGARS
jgi:hypothetical protein